MGLFQKKKKISQEERQVFKQRLEKEILEYIQEDYGDVHLNDTFDDIGMDDLDIFDMITYFEDIYHIHIPFIEDDVLQVQSLQEVVDCFVNAL